MTATETGHRHSFPCNPPGGTFLNPGPCECGKTLAQDEADRALKTALDAVTAAYGVRPRVSEQWAVHWAGDDLNNGIGLVEFRDDEEDAREKLQFYGPGASVVRRTVIALRWEPVTGEEPAS